MTETLRPLDTSRLTPLPNPDAELFTETTGLKFKQTPQRYKLNLRAIWEIAKMEKKRLAQLGQLIQVLIFPPAGLYELTSGSIFTSNIGGRRGSKIIAAHENAHAWIYQEKPDFRKAEEFNNILNAKIENNSVNMVGGKDLDIQEIICKKVVGEGLATSLSMEVLTKSRRKDAGETINKDEGITYATAPVKKRKVKRALKKTDKAARQFTKYVIFAHSPLRIFSSTFNVIRASFSLVKAQYIAGEYFCSYVISELLKRGKTLPQSVKTIVQDLPKKIDEIKNPEIYVIRILGISQTATAAT